MSCKTCASIRRWFNKVLGLNALGEQLVKYIEQDRAEIRALQDMLGATNSALSTLEKRTMKADQTLIAAIEKTTSDIEDRLVVIRETINATREDLRKVGASSSETDEELGTLAERVSVLENPDFKPIEFKLNEMKDG